MKADQHAREMNEKVRNINEMIRQIKQRSLLPVRLLDVADMMERSLPDDASSDGIHFDKPRGVGHSGVGQAGNGQVHLWSSPNTLLGWTATDRPLEIPPDNLDSASSTWTSKNFLSGEWG